jgi:hypothetical protein
MHRICHIKFWISIETQIERLFGSNLNTESVPNYLLLLKLTYTHLNTRIYRCSFKFLFKVGVEESIANAQRIADRGSAV